ncbi:MAG: DUF169 domain-containing protein [Candidatus Methanoperedens sp.]|nr:DUF169 domain-containing protein [Candidatus Methanoperedens sp.]
MLKHIPALMCRGKPVSVVFTQEKGEDTDMLYCEIIQKARFGESFLIHGQGCSVGAYVLGDSENQPGDYYYESGRYVDRTAAGKAAFSLHRLRKKHSAIRIAPYPDRDFDILLLFLKPERAMRIIQALAYHDGKPVEFRTGGTASVCSECTACPVEGKTGISFGCKGSRKHSGYGDDELVVGIPFLLAWKLDEALGKIPGSRQ